MILLKHLSLAVALTVLSASAKAAEEAVPIDKGEWITSEDYPPSATAEGIEGRVKVELSVAATGLPVDCKVAHGSGDWRMDDYTCQLLLERAKFEPDADIGYDVAKYRTSVVWQLNPRKPLAPVDIRVSFVIDEDGNVSDCHVDARAADLPKKPCPDDGFFEPFTDSEGNPVKKRVTLRQSVEIDDLE
ncbi:TonB family protein [Croceicoccus bisphenolivorans]|uniref:TonB family protein n=1 Tax=Croceicoccus bisphenolivorans TaxID=1783232 RepID=UPI0008357645|nr:TonB family protein [Croceicoccus bisphenolivorans]